MPALLAITIGSFHLAPLAAVCWLVCGALFLCFLGLAVIALRAYLRYRRTGKF